jgi:hypothetical protein
MLDFQTMSSLLFVSLHFVRATFFPVLHVQQTAISDLKYVTPHSFSRPKPCGNPFEGPKKALFPGIVFQHSEKLLFRQGQKGQNLNVYRTRKNIISQCSGKGHPTLVDGPGKPGNPEELVPAASGDERARGSVTPLRFVQSLSASTT